VVDTVRLSGTNDGFHTLMVWAALVVPTGRDANVKLAGETTIAGRQRMHCPAAGKPISNSAKGAMELSKYRRSFCVRFILILLDLVGSIDHLAQDLSNYCNASHNGCTAAVSPLK